jgi:hypothetical protein
MCALTGGRGAALSPYIVYVDTMPAVWTRRRGSEPCNRHVTSATSDVSYPHGLDAMGFSQPSETEWLRGWLPCNIWVGSQTHPT